MIRAAFQSASANKHWFSRYFIAVIILFGLVSSAGAVDLNDGFERADNSALGNGWIEKNAGAFNLQTGTASKQAVSTGYRDNVVYRPASEDLLDQEASIELNWQSGSIGYPQVFVRLQSASVAQYNTLDGYILYVSDNANQAILGRQVGSQFVSTLATLYLSTPLNTTDLFRMRIRAVGASPVQLSAWIEQFVSGSWQIIGQATVTDSTAEQINTPGAVGFGGYVENSYSFDNFQRLDLDGAGGTPTNPVPVATTLTPDNAPAGNGDLTITVNGSDFIASSVVRWNGANRPTTMVSATQLNADISAADLSTAGSATVTVFNPTPGGGESAPLSFTINQPIGNPVPQTAAINPANALEGGSAFLLTVTGTNFVPATVVRWNGADRTTTFISDTELQATIPDTDIAVAGSAIITVFTPTPGGGTSNSQTFTIDPVVAGNPVPAIINITPSNVTEGSSSFSLTVNGNAFVPGAVVRWNGSDRITTFVSATLLTATITAADVASAGSADITVFNPAPGGGLSNLQTLNIDAGGPTTVQTLNNISPNSAVVGDASALLAIYGNGFTTSSVVRLDGIDLPTTFVSATQLSATIGATLLADNARSAVMVYTPEASNSLVGPTPFFVLDAGDTLFVDDFNRPDGPDIGNQWTEKLPSAFALENGRVTSVDTTPSGFNYNLVYRPEAEDAANIEVATEFIRTGTFTRYPQVHSRALRDNISETSRLNSYTAFLYDSYEEFLTITPIVDGSECYLAQFPLIRPTQFGERYRIRLRTLGTGTVRLTAYLDHFNVDRWETISAGTIIHDANSQPTPGYFCNLGFIPPPLGSGGVGFAKYYGATDDYDSFYSIRLTSDNNAVPVTTSLVPSSASVGSAAFPVTVNGADFVPGAVVRWNGSDLPTTYIDTTRLEVQVGPAELATAGTADVTVFNPAPGGGESDPLVFTVGIGGVGFFDNFDRPDNTLLGNGWIETNPSAFVVSNGQVVKQVTNGGYLDNLVYRPSFEDLLDVEASMEFQVLPTAPGYPQLFARIQSATVSPSWVDGYMLYVNDNATELILGRQRGYSFVTPLSVMTLAAGLELGTTYRMRLQVTGTNPVTLQANVDIRTPTGGWQVIGQTTAIDSSAERIDTAGSVGFSGYVFDGYVYDNFLRANLTQ